MNNTDGKMKLTTPTLLLDETKCRANIGKIAKVADLHNLTFRPHFKTHNSHLVGSWFREAGVRKITVASVDMARHFAADGWTDITIAFPFNILEMEAIHALPAALRLHLTVCSETVAAVLAQHSRRELGIWIKIDSGYGRTGLLPGQREEMEKIMSIVSGSRSLQFRGFLTHAGHTYHASTPSEVLDIHRSSLDVMSDLRETLSGSTNPVISSLARKALISTGDTPSCSLAADFNGTDEIRPGNFVFYDVMQAAIGSCSYDEIAVCLACPVVAKHPQRSEIIIHGGAVHLSKDNITDKNGKTIYGKVVQLCDHGWSAPLEDCYLSSLSQEHGVITAGTAAYSLIGEGAMIGILPVHSCLTMAAMQTFRLISTS